MELSKVPLDCVTAAVNRAQNGIFYFQFCIFLDLDSMCLLKFL